MIEPVQPWLVQYIFIFIQFNTYLFICHWNTCSWID